MPRPAAETILSIAEGPLAKRWPAILKVTGAALAVAGVSYAAVKNYLEYDQERLDNAEHYGRSRRLGAEFNGPGGPDPSFNRDNGQFEKPLPPTLPSPNMPITGS